MSNFIPVHEPVLAGNEKKYLAECIDTGWVSSEGRFVKAFEESYARFLNVNHGIAVANGTAALEVALYAIGVKPGDEVIIPAFTIISCALACVRLGVIPVLVDIDPETWTMDVSQLEKKISSKTVAIMAVHIYGHPVDMDPIYELQERFSLKIVEDIAEAQGSRYFSRYKGGVWLNCGKLGDISATSFYANKIITTGEGGMVCSDVKEYAERAKSYRNLCFGVKNRFEHVDLGYNFRMSNLQAAVGLAQLEAIDGFLLKKKKMAAWYQERINKLPGIHFMKVKDWADSSYWMYCVTLAGDQDIDAEKIMYSLSEQGIGVRPFFCGLHKQPALKDWVPANDEYPNTDDAYKFGFYLPGSVSLHESDIDRIVSALGKALMESVDE